MRKSRQATESEGKAFRMSEADVTAPALTLPYPLRARGLWTNIHLSASFRNVPRTTEHSCSGFWVPLLRSTASEPKALDKATSQRLTQFPGRSGDHMSPGIGSPFLPWRWFIALFRVLAPSGCESAGWARKKGDKNCMHTHCDSEMQAFAQELHGQTILDSAWIAC